MHACRSTLEDPTPLAELTRETVICFERCPYWQAVSRRLEDEGLSVRPRLLVGRPSWLLQAVSAGLGVGIISRHQTPTGGLVCRPLRDPPLEPEITLTTKRGRLYSPPVRAFVELALTPRRAQQVLATLSA